MTRSMGILVGIGALLAASVAVATDGVDTLRLERVNERVYAVVGALGNRDPENLGNNATFGVVLTGDGVVLVDPGGSRRGAAAIDAMIRQLTDAPVILVINTGGQDHRWMGNGYFKERGARIVASAATVADHQEREQDQLIGLSSLIGADNLEGTDPVFAGETFDDETVLEIGGVRFELFRVGPAHTPGDTLVWLPEDRVVFTGDVVYVGRMLGVIPVSSSSNWLDAFGAMEALDPLAIVPGHGPVTDVATARADTLDYLTFLREEVALFMDEGRDISEVGAIDQSRFRYLENFDELSGRNAQQVFQQMEWE